MSVSSIPSGHMFHTMEKPIVIGHRGNPKKFQENTLDGFKSLVDINAGAYEVDVYKTKDDKLVAFHDESTKRMTGVDKLVWESTYEELQELNITAKQEMGGKTYTFDKQRKIPLLEDILEEMSDTDLMLVLELKPSTPRSGDEQLTAKTSNLVAQLLTKLNLENRSFVISFDPRKLMIVKAFNEKLVTGLLIYPNQTLDVTCIEMESNVTAISTLYMSWNTEETYAKKERKLTTLMEKGDVVQLILTDDVFRLNKLLTSSGGLLQGTFTSVKSTFPQTGLFFKISAKIS